MDKGNCMTSGRALTILLCVMLLAQTGFGFVTTTRVQPASISYWQEEADARIKAIRMGDLVIEVRDEQGKPVLGATISGVLLLLPARALSHHDTKKPLVLSSMPLSMRMR